MFEKKAQDYFPLQSLACPKDRGFCCQNLSLLPPAYMYVHRLPLWFKSPPSKYGLEPLMLTRWSRAANTRGAASPYSL